MKNFHKSNFFIIFIDDEEKTVKNFKKFFDDEFKIVATTQINEVWNFINNKSNEIAVIISDQKMPKINGVDLLTEVKEINHNIIRILTTAYASLENNIDAINKGNIFAYLTKPWNLNEVRIILHKALSEFEARQNYLSLSGSIAHEMRNPLNTVRQATQIAKEKLYSANIKNSGDISDKEAINLSQKDFNEIIYSLEIANKSAKRGDLIIDIILNSLKQKPLDVGGLETLRVSEIIESVMEEYAFRANEKERIKIDIKTDFLFRANDALLSYVFFNLFKNALYYSNSHPNLTIEIKAKAGHDGFNRIYIKDSGPGIDENKIANLFEAFSTSGKQGGTGLGLVFCKRTMKNFGGNIFCNSNKNEFSEFILTFPKVATKKNQNFQNQILIISAKKNSFRTLKKLLEEDLESTHFIHAENEEEALFNAQNNYCNLVLIDDENDIFFAEKIREFNREIPIIAYSGKDRFNFKKPEFNDYLSKESSHNLILQTIAKWGMINIKNFLISETEVQKSLKNQHILIVDDEYVNLILTGKFFEKFHTKIDEAKTGIDAFEKVKTTYYDLILMDIEMPEMDGITAVKNIREYHKKQGLSHVPIIAITGENTKEKIFAILNAGFDDYFVKGKDYKDLAKIVAFWKKNKV